MAQDFLDQYKALLTEIAETALLPIHGVWLCDGLLFPCNVSIGKNMIHDMIQELKIERRKWATDDEQP